MTLAEFATNVVPVINMVIAGLGLLSLLGLFWQIRETRLWNKINTQHNLVDNLPTQDLERQVYVAFAKFQIPRDGTISEAAATALYDDIESFLAVKTFLNKFEVMCAAINLGSIDADYAYAVHSARVISAYTMFHHMIELCREKRKSLEFYIELEKVALDWERKKTMIANQQEAEVRKLQDNLKKSIGISGKA